MVRPAIAISAFSLLVLLTGSASAQERDVGDGAVIRGNQEQPKVLYIVPWQAPSSPELLVPEPKSDVSGVYRPIERDFYRQSLYFRRHLKMGVLPDNR